ncbi:hypothetical protein BC332_13555 [Capsicum chinense]|nr:hypothetical protein BC332_13555 [Capsicum chinense]
MTNNSTSDTSATEATPNTSVPVVLSYAKPFPDVSNIEIFASENFKRWQERIFLLLDVHGVAYALSQTQPVAKEAKVIWEALTKKFTAEDATKQKFEQWSLNGKTDQVSFKNCVPIVTHKDLEPYIHRIADGDLTPILTGKTINTISLREFPVVNGKALQLIYGSKQFKMKGGLAAGTATTNVYKNSQFKKSMKAMQTPC